MNRFLFASLVLAFALSSTACDKAGLYPYGRKTDVINSCGPDSSVYLHSSDTGTDILIIGNLDPSKVVGASARRCLLAATVDRDSSTRLSYGEYDRSASGAGTFELLAEYEFRYEPELNIGGRLGSERTDYKPGDILDPMSMTVAGDEVTFEYMDVTRTYTNLDTVMTRIDLATPEGPIDLYQLYNLALFLGQVRIPAFGGLGMTRYITAPGYFDGLVQGQYSISVGSIAAPTATISYTELEDFPLIIVNGTQVTKVNINGNGPMDGALQFVMRDSVDPTVIHFAGNVVYGTGEASGGGIVVSDGIASSGNYTLNVTTPTTLSIQLPYTYAANVDLRHIVPVSP